MQLTLCMIRVSRSSSIATLDEQTHRCVCECLSRANDPTGIGLSSSDVPVVGSNSNNVSTEASSVTVKCTGFSLCELTGSPETSPIAEVVRSTFESL